MSVRSWVAGILILASMSAAHAATHQVRVFSFGFDPRTVNVQPGDTVVWSNSGGSHNVVADDGSFTNGGVSSSPWTFSRVFNSPGDVGYYCAPHGQPDGIGMAGIVRVAGITPPPFVINYGTGGTWYNAATSGQGFFVEVVPSLNLMVVAWFTWTNTPGVHDWITAIGPISGNSATLDLQRSTGGKFNDPATVTTTSVGTATARFTSCSAGTITFQRNDLGLSGTIPITRLTVTPAACTTPTSTAGE